MRSAMDWSVENIGDKVKVLDYVQTYTTTPNKDKLGTFTAQTKAKVIDLLANSTATPSRRTGAPGSRR